MKTKFLVSTTLGDSILDLTDMVFINPTPKEVLKKQVSDINIGEKVMFLKSETRTSLENVEPYLPRSPRYKKAKALLHEINSLEEYIPKLRTLLMRGLAEEGMVQHYPDLEERVLLESKDIAGTEYSGMKKRIHGLLKDTEHSRSFSRIGEWLRGRTVAPRPWDIFRYLEDINPEFNEFQKYDGDPKSMYYNYTLYVVIRRGIMRYLNHCKGTTAYTEGLPSAESKISLGPEYAIIFDHFMQDKNEEHAFARILDIKTLLKPKQVKHVKETNDLLGEGIIRNVISENEIYPIDYGTVYKKYYFFHNYFLSAVEVYMDTVGIDPPFAPEKPFEGIYTIGVSCLPDFFERFGEGIDKGHLEIIRLIKSMLGKESEAKVKEIVDVLIDDILMGDFDAALGENRGNTMKLIEIIYHLRRALPRAYFDYEGASINNETKNYKNKLVKMGFEFDGEVIVTGYGFFSELLRNEHPFRDRIPKYRTPRQYLLDPELKMDWLPDFMEKHPEGFFTESESKEILDDYGLGSFLDVRSHDFLWERM